jgi:NADPH:quinone reductase-like Zn-dependent oxidoreductase
MLIHKPDELTHLQCAAIPETWITALQALYVVAGFTDNSNKTVLWHAGASAVSIAGIQLSLAGGSPGVFATARQDSKVEFCVHELGCKAAFNSETSDWPREVQKATDGNGVDIIVDFIGGPALQGNLDALGRDGRMVNLAALGGTKIPAGADMGQFFRKRLRIEGSGLRSRDLDYQKKLRDQLVEHALPRFKDGRFKILIEKELDWEKIVEAHELMESNATKGKIICTIKW